MTDIRHMLKIEGLKGSTKFEVYWESRNDFHDSTVDVYVTLAGVPIHQIEAEFEVGEPSWERRAGERALAEVAALLSRLLSREADLDRVFD